MFEGCRKSPQQSSNSTYLDYLGRVSAVFTYFHSRTSFILTNVWHKGIVVGKVMTYGVVCSVPYQQF